MGRRHLRAFGALLLLSLALAVLTMPAARLPSFLDLPTDERIQIFTLDAWVDAAGIMKILSSADEAERAAEIQREREAREQQEAIARRAGSPVAYIVVRGGQLLRSDRRPSDVDRIAPTAPRNVTVGAVSDTSIELSWEASDDDVAILGYEVVREGTAPFNATSTSFTDTGLRAGTTYCYKVIAMDDAGNRSAEGNGVCATTRDMLPPTVPDRVVATVQPPDTVVLSWSESVDDAGSVAYEVLDGTDIIATVTRPTWTHSGAERRQHRYSVRAVDRAGNRSVNAPPAVVSLADLEPPTTPAEVKLTSDMPTRIIVQWAASTDNRGVARYEVLAAGKVVAISAGTSAAVVALDESQEHCFAVRAIDSEGNRSAPTNAVCRRTMDRDAWNAARNEGRKSFESMYYGAGRNRRSRAATAATSAGPESRP